MSFLLQATTTVDDFDAFRTGVEWLEGEVGEVEGLISFRVFRQSDNPSRVTILEEWASADAFQRSFEHYSVEQRGEFLARIGLTSESFERAFWESTDIAPAVAQG